MVPLVTAPLVVPLPLVVPAPLVVAPLLPLTVAVWVWLPLFPDAVFVCVT